MWLGSCRHVAPVPRIRRYFSTTFQLFQLFLAHDDAVCSITHLHWSKVRSDRGSLIHVSMNGEDSISTSLKITTAPTSLMRSVEQRTCSDDPTGPFRRSWQPCPTVSNLISSLHGNWTCTSADLYNKTTQGGWPHLQRGSGSTGLPFLLCYSVKTRFTTNMCYDEVMHTLLYTLCLFLFTQYFKLVLVLFKWNPATSWTASCTLTHRKA